MTQTKKRIMIVDDDQDICLTLKLILEKYGFDAECFTSSLVAIEKFRPNQFNLMILDIKMPELNGFELYDKIKKKDANIKTIFLTALANVEDYNTQNKKVYPLKGERHFLSKAVSSNELLTNVCLMIGS